MPESALLARELTYSYPGAARPALAGISLAVEPGEFVVLAGGSGSGKSTLLRAAAGLVPHFHGGEASGSLRIAGVSVREHGPSDLASVCGSVFQDPEAQVVMGGVRAEIALPLEHRGDPPAAVARGVEEAALALGIGHLLDRRTDTLSGGELQRVALAAALAPHPEVLALDEPTSQLDPVASDELVSLLRRLNEEWGTTVLLAEHRLEPCQREHPRRGRGEPGRLGNRPVEELGRRRVAGDPPVSQRHDAVGDPARGGPAGRGRRGGRAHGSQRRGQEHAAAPRPRARGAHPGPG